MKQVVGLSIALVASLTWAYVVWTTPEEEPGAAEGVELYPATLGDVTALTWTSESLDVKATRRKDARGDYVWVDVTERKVKKKKPENHPDPHGEADGHPEEAPKEPGAPDAPAPEPAEEIEVKTSSFFAGAAGDDLWKAFAPLRALRELPAPKDKATYGLDAPKATLTVERAGGPVVVTVGGEVFGTKDRYVEVAGKVYLLDDAATKSLEHPNQQLVAKAFSPLEEREIEAIAVTAAAGEGRWIHTNREDPKAAGWALASAPTERIEAAKAWIGKFLSVRTKEYPAADALPATLATAATFAIEGDGQTWKVEILSDGGEPAKWFARPEWARATVTLPELPIREVVEDLPSQLGAPAKP